MIKAVGSGSNRYNKGKVRMSYIPPKTQFDLLRFVTKGVYYLPVYGIAKLSEHFSLGVAKYPDEVIDNVEFPNWSKGQYFDKMLINCVLRHYYAWLNGEEIDSDFGSHHLIAVAWGLCCLHHQFSNYELYKKFDDRMWVGFKYSQLNHDEVDNSLVIRNALQIIQCSDDIEQCVILCIETLFDVLNLFQECTMANNPIVDFKIDEERLSNIKNKNYGTPVTATS